MALSSVCSYPAVPWHDCLPRQRPIQSAMRHCFLNAGSEAASRGTHKSSKPDPVLSRVQLEHRYESLTIETCHQFPARRKGLIIKVKSSQILSFIQFLYHISCSEEFWGLGSEIQSITGH